MVAVAARRAPLPRHLPRRGAQPAPQEPRLVQPAELAQQRPAAAGRAVPAIPGDALAQRRGRASTGGEPGEQGEPEQRRRPGRDRTRARSAGFRTIRGSLASDGRQQHPASSRRRSRRQRRRPAGLVFRQRVARSAASAGRTRPASTGEPVRRAAAARRRPASRGPPRRSGGRRRHSRGSGTRSSSDRPQPAERAAAGRPVGERGGRSPPGPRRRPVRSACRRTTYAGRFPPRRSPFSPRRADRLARAGAAPTPASWPRTATPPARTSATARVGPVGGPNVVDDRPAAPPPARPAPGRGRRPRPARAASGPARRRRPAGRGRAAAGRASPDAEQEQGEVARSDGSTALTPGAWSGQGSPAGVVAGVGPGSPTPAGRSGLIADRCRRAARAAARRSPSPPRSAGTARRAARTPPRPDCAHAGVAVDRVDHQRGQPARRSACRRRGGCRAPSAAPAPGPRPSETRNATSSTSSSPTAHRSADSQLVPGLRRADVASTGRAAIIAASPVETDDARNSGDSQVVSLQTGWLVALSSAPV